MPREIFEWVELDVPRCSRAYGSAPCAAVLGSTGPRKCFNTRGTCQDIANFTEGTPTTLKFAKAEAPQPHGFKGFPVLGRVRQSSTTVNIAGADPKYGQLGRRATLDFELTDFTYHDRAFDLYQAERVSGAAQTDEGGYNPADRGTFLAKLKARWPNYAGAEVRLCRAYMDGGALSDQTTYYHRLVEMAGPARGSVSVSCLDVLDLANPKTALCPKPSPGALTLDLDAVATTFSITPAEAAPSYAASGWVCLGSEIMAFTRSGVTFTVTRGQRGTTAKTHSQGDTVQQTYSVRNARLDDTAKELIEDFTDTPPSWITFAEWQAEVTRWGGSVLLTTDVCQPTPVATLLAELGDLGCNIVPDERAKKLRLRMNRPVDGETVYDVSDAKSYSIEGEDTDEQRLTQVYFLAKRIDPTKNMTDDNNFLHRRLTVNNDALDLFGEVKSRTVRTRWLDAGDDATIRIVSWRLLKRFERAPLRVTAVVDAKDKAISLMDVADLQTVDFADDTGNAKTVRTQVIGRSEPTPYHDVSLILQRFEFDGRYGFITPNDWPNYNDATAAQKAAGAWIVDEANLKFDDNSSPYKVI